jgi:hypothetical protein
MVATYIKGTGDEVPAELQTFIDEPAPQSPGGETAASLPFGDQADSAKPAVAEAGADDKAGDQTPNDTGQSESPVGPEELVKARQALKTWQYSDEVLDTMPPDEILKRGRKAAESQSNANRKISEGVNASNDNQRLLDELAELRQLVESSRTTPDPELDSASDDVAASVLPADIMNDDIHQDLAEVLDPILHEHRQKLADYEQRFASQNQSHDEMLMEISRRDLTSEFPLLREDESFQTVKDKVYELANLDGYHDENGKPLVDRLMTDASRVVLGAAKAQQQQQDLTTRYSGQTGGQPDDADDSSDDTVEGGAMDRNAKLLYAQKLLADEGKTHEQVRTILAKIPDA